MSVRTRDCILEEHYMVEEYFRETNKILFGCLLMADLTKHSHSTQISRNDLDGRALLGQPSKSQPYSC